MSEQEATRIAEAVIYGVSTCTGLRLKIISEYTTKVPGGWLFSYNSEKFVSKRDEGDRLIGCSPIFIDETGKPHLLPTYQSSEKSLRDLKESR